MYLHNNITIIMYKNYDYTTVKLYMASYDK